MVHSTYHIYQGGKLMLEAIQERKQVELPLYCDDVIYIINQQAWKKFKKWERMLSRAWGEKTN